MLMSTAFAGILPYATSYNSHTINHAIATPIAPAPFVAAAPAPFVAAPYAAPFASPYSSYPYSYSYPYLF